MILLIENYIYAEWDLFTKDNIFRLYISLPKSSGKQI